MHAHTLYGNTNTKQVTLNTRPKHSLITHLLNGPETFTRSVFTPDQTSTSKQTHQKHTVMMLHEESHVSMIQENDITLSHAHT